MLILRNRDVFLLWAGQVLSQAGTRMQQIALAWWIVALRAGGSGTKLGVFMVAGALPAILLVRVVGRTVDAGSPKRILVTADLLSGLAAAAVGTALALGRLTFPAACLGGFLLASIQAFFDPALNKAVAEAAGPEDIEEAVAFQSSTQSLASFAGAVAGALLIDRLGMAGVLFLNAASFLLSAAANACLAMRHAAPPAAAEEAGALTGWRILERRPVIKRVLIVFGLVNFFMTPILVVLPLYVKQVLAGSASMLGSLEAALWIGLVAGTAAAGWKGFGADTLRIGAWCLAAIGASLALPGAVAGRWLLAAALFLAGAALGVNNVKFVSLFQRSLAPEHKGRFFALMQALVSFSFPAAFFLFGVLTDALDPRQVFLVQGAGVLALAAYFARLARAPLPAGPREGACGLAAPASP